jgi:hypothetical protein
LALLPALNNTVLFNAAPPKAILQAPLVGVVFAPPFVIFSVPFTVKFLSIFKECIALKLPTPNVQAFPIVTFPSTEMVLLAELFPISKLKFPVEVLEIPAEKILNAFGEYWVLKIAAQSYNDLMTSTGTGFVSFLENIDGMHSRIKVTMPDLNPPSFRVKKINDTKIQIDYFSSRAGLLPFVEGLLSGLGTYYNQKFVLTHIPKSENPLPSERMQLEFI